MGTNSKVVKFCANLRLRATINRVKYPKTAEALLSIGPYYRGDLIGAVMEKYLSAESYVKEAPKESHPLPDGAEKTEEKKEASAAETSESSAGRVDRSFSFGRSPKTS